MSETYWKLENADLSADGVESGARCLVTGDVLGWGHPQGYYLSDHIVQALRNDQIEKMVIDVAQYDHMRHLIEDAEQMLEWQYRNVIARADTGPFLKTLNKLRREIGKSEIS